VSFTVSTPEPATQAAPQAAPAKARGKKVYCQRDDWYFDPRYTDGACPICGWSPPAANLQAAPAWLVRAQQLPWDVIFLILLFVVLVVMGVLVGMAAHYKISPPNGG